MNNEYINDDIKKALACYKYIDAIGEKLSKIISKQIEPLLNDYKYSEAKKVLNDFYEPSRYKCEIIFIEYDIILANINYQSKTPK